MQPDFAQASAFVAALTGDANSVFDWRCIHDRDKAVPSIKRRGPLAQLWQELCGWNTQGYGIFAVINETDGNGVKLENIRANRAHFIDLDNLQSFSNYQRAAAWQPAPTFAVQSSPNKFHVYWRVSPYSGNDAFLNLQKKLIQFFESDAKVSDPTRVMRVPGFYHQKGEPYLSHCWALSGYGRSISVDALAISLAHVQIIETGYGLRRPLGDPDLAAPSLDWVKYALDCTDPNSLDRASWISFTAAVKQAAWTLAEPQAIFDMWSAWCARYTANDPGENLKQWNDLTETQLGWKSIVNRVPQVKAYLAFGGKQHVPPQQGTTPDAPQFTGPVETDTNPTAEMLTPEEQAQYFRGCYIISTTGAILAPDKKILSQTAFNARYGGRLFIISTAGKTTDEPYKAATRNTMFKLPMVDKLRFLPHMPTDAIVTDELGGKGINVYIPPRIRRVQGDPSYFLRHLALMFPNTQDQQIILSYMAANAQFPGRKIAWSILMQSAEGAGKGVFKDVLKYNSGSIYFYSPKAQDLAESGAKFNKWMRNRVMIVVDEIRTDERRDMIEILKPFISENEIEIQGKGQDQELEDNFANWFFFSNYKDAIPINLNSRRYAIFYSVLQSASDIQAAQMGQAYFNALHAWLKADGHAIIYDYLMNYPIGDIPARAPVTSSFMEALRQSQSAIERMVSDAVQDGVAGFKGGWVSTSAMVSRMRAIGQRQASLQVLERVLEGMGYHYAGRATRAYLGEDATIRASLYHAQPGADVMAYGPAQGYAA